MRVIPLKLEKESKNFDLYRKLVDNKNNVSFQNGDLLIISSKYLSIGEGRIKKLEDVKPTVESIELSKLYHINPKLMELVVRESDEIFGGLYGFVLTTGTWNIVSKCWNRQIKHSAWTGCVISKRPIQFNRNSEKKILY